MEGSQTVYGMQRLTGKPIYNLSEAVRESILDILLTPRGSRPMRPNYGLNMVEIVDRPVNEALDLYIIIAEAISEWEPRFRLREVQAEAVGGRLSFRLFGELRDTGESLTVGGELGG